MMADDLNISLEQDKQRPRSQSMPILNQRAELSGLSQTLEAENRVDGAIPATAKTAATPLRYYDMAKLNQDVDQANQEYQRSLGKYKADGGNVFLKHLMANKPQRDVDKEKRLKNSAKLGMLTELLGLVGKGIGAFGGIKPKADDKTRQGVLSSLGQLERLNQIYEAKGDKWDNDTLRAKVMQDQDAQAMAKFGIGAASNKLNAAREALAAGAKQEYDAEAKANDRAFDLFKGEKDRAFRAGENAKNRANTTRNAGIKANDGAKRDKDWVFDAPSVTGAAVPITNKKISELRMWGAKHPDQKVRSLVGELELKGTGASGESLNDADKQAMFVRLSELNQRKESEERVVDDMMVLTHNLPKKLTPKEWESLIENPEYQHLGIDKVSNMFKQAGLL